MKDSYSYKVYPHIGRAMKTHNTIMPGEKFSLIDLNVLCYVKSFNDAGLDFFMSSAQIADHLVLSERAVRNSINYLCEIGFLKKLNQSRRRTLSYQYATIDKFINEMNTEE